MKPEVEIRNWCIAKSLNRKTDAPALYGIPTGHPDPKGYVSNKKIICSSPIIYQNDEIVETENTVYKLVGSGLTKAELLARLKLIARTALN